MKPTESSEEGHGRVSDGGAQHGGLATAPVLNPATASPDTQRADFGGGGDAPVRSVSGVVAAPAAGAEMEGAHTTVEPGPARRFEASEGVLSGRIRHAMDRTLPLGTPVPDPALFAAARRNRDLHSRTMLLGGRHLAELGAEPEPPTLRADSALTEAVTPRAPELPATQRTPLGHGGVAPAAPHAAARAAAQRFLSERTERFGAEVAPPTTVRADAPQDGALRASFVRSVGLPTAPPPRRRRTIPPGGLQPFDASPASEPAAAGAPRAAGDEADHEAFALERPRGPSVPPGLAAQAAPRAVALSASTAGSNGAAGRGSLPFVRIPDARNPRARALSNSVILPPPPQPHDYELSSSPSAAPPPLAFAATAKAGSAAQAAASAFAVPVAAVAFPATSPAKSPATSPPARPRPSLLDLPSVGGNPLAGYEAPRETFWQRSLIVFVVALAIVGLFALGAIGLGFLGKTGW